MQPAESGMDLDTFPQSSAPAHKFHLSNTRLLLTYRVHVNKAVIRELMEQQGEVVFCRTAHETAHGDTPYSHSHVLVKWNDRIQTENQRLFDVQSGQETVHPDICPVTTSLQWDASVRDLAKEDADNQDLLTQAYSRTKRESSAPTIWKCETVQEAMDKLAEPHAKAVIALYRYGSQEEREEVSPLINEHSWSKQLRGELAAKPNPRQIIWVVDTVGNTGKSALCKHLSSTDQQSFLVVTRMSQTRSVMTLVTRAIAKGEWNKHAVLLDLPRKAARSYSLYETVGMLKDGMITTLGCAGKTLVFDSPHVVVFANFWPDTTQLTGDRWDVREIRDGDFVGVAVEDAQRAFEKDQAPFHKRARRAYNIKP